MRVLDARMLVPGDVLRFGSRRVVEVLSVGERVISCRDSGQSFPTFFPAFWQAEEQAVLVTPGVAAEERVQG